MNPLAIVYLPYASVALALTIWLARALSRHGEVFLVDVFRDKPALATAINQLLVIGFYLVNLGWSLLLLRQGIDEVTTITAALELLTTKLGVLLLLLGAAHFTNMFVFHKIRHGRAQTHG